MVSNSVKVTFKDDSSYVDVDVLTREVDCSSLDEATFVEYIMHDVVQANKNLADFRHKHGYLPRDSHFFDFKADPTYFGIPYDCIINDKITEKQAKGCFEFNKNVSYFRNALGWKFTFRTKLSEMYPSFRAEVKLILPDDVEKDRNDAERRLCDNVSSFLKDVTYFGD